MLQCVKGFRLPRTCLHLDMLFFWLAFWYCFQTQFQWLSIFVRSLDRADFLLFFIGVGIYLGMFAGLKFQCFQKKHQKFSSAFYFLFFFLFLFLLVPTVSFANSFNFFLQFFSFVHHQTEEHIWNASIGSHMPNWEQRIHKKN